MDELFNPDVLYHGLEPTKAWLGAAIGATAAAVGAWVANRRQKKENREIAQYQADIDTKFLDKQNEYNTPANQMARFQEAGLNPNLIYGQGNPGNQSTAQQYPQIKAVDYQRSMENILPLANQTSLIQSQVQATNAKTRQTGVLTALNQLQIQVMQKNPLLDDAGFKATIDGLKSSAEIKASDSAIRSAQADWFTGQQSFKINGVDMHGPAGVLKMETELNLLIQKFNLGTQDQAVKAEIIKGKEFNNALLEIQKKWMSDGEITPQHIYQFIQLLLLKML